MTIHCLLVTCRQLELDLSIQDLTTGMSVEEIISRLKDRMAQHNNKIREAFNRYDVKRNGKVTKKNFRHVNIQRGDEYKKHFLIRTKELYIYIPEFL